jgi:hypothetical protein
MSTQFSPQDALEFLQKMWNPLGMPIPGFQPPGTPGAAPGPLPFPNPASMMAALDPAEVEKKIAELRIVENWLGMTLSWVQMSIKTMELQKSSLEALRAATGAVQAVATPPAMGGERRRRGKS